MSTLNVNHDYMLKIQVIFVSPFSTDTPQYQNQVYEHHRFMTSDIVYRIFT